MRPGRLRQVFDDAGNAVVAFDQQHVAGLDDAAQMLGITGRERLIARDFLLEVARNQLANRIEHYAHDIPLERFFTAFLFHYHGRKPFQFSSCGSGSIMIHLP